MTSHSPRSSSDDHAAKDAGRELVRMEIRAARSDRPLIRALAEKLRGESEQARKFRSFLTRALHEDAPKTAFDFLASDLPDEAFEGVFDQPREKGWRENEN